MSRYSYCMTTLIVREGGKLIIPPSLRRSLGLPGRKRLLAFPTAGGLLLAGSVPKGESLSARAQKAMKKSRTTLGELLREARSQRTRYNRETYGR